MRTHYKMTIQMTKAEEKDFEDRGLLDEGHIKGYIAYDLNVDGWLWIVEYDKSNRLITIDYVRI